MDNEKVRLTGKIKMTGESKDVGEKNINDNEESQKDRKNQNNGSQWPGGGDQKTSQKLK